MAPDLFTIFLGEGGARGGLWTASRGEEQGTGRNHSDGADCGHEMRMLSEQLLFEKPQDAGEGSRGIPQFVSLPLPSKSFLADVVGICRASWLGASADGLQLG